jgi:FG-GAP repeat protein
MQGRGSVWLATVALAAAAPVSVALTASAAPRPPAAHHVAARGDFDGDGTPDLVAGAPGGDRVRVIYSKATPGGSHSQWIDSPDPDALDFGATLAVGDFNGDGYADLAVGAPDYTGSDTVQRGAVFIFNGSKTGLHDKGVVFKGPDDFDDDNELGTSLAAGKANTDRFGDLAIGNPGPAGGGDSSGSVLVVFGSATGLSLTASIGLSSAAPVENGEFGTSVAFGDVNGDGHTDLIVGEPGGGSILPSSSDYAGDIQVIYGTAAGLGPKHKTLGGSTLGAAGALGWSLAAGDVNHDGYTDVVAGAPAATVHGQTLAGKAVVLLGGKHGLSAKNRRVFSEDSPRVPGAAVSTDRFGYSVAVGDLTGDRRADVVVGAPGAVADKQPAGGAVYVFRGAASGATTKHCQRLTQASKGIPGVPLSGSELGSAVATLGTAAAAHRDLLIGVPAMHKGGVILVLRGGSGAVTGKHVHVHKDAATGDGFGSAFAP